MTDNRPTRDDLAGRTYLELRRAARADGRLTDEYLRLYVLEGFLARLAVSQHSGEEDAYSGVRVSLTARLATAVIRFHVDVNVGDPISPEPEHVQLPWLLGGEITLRGLSVADGACREDRHLRRTRDRRFRHSCFRVAVGPSTRN